MKKTVKYSFIPILITIFIVTILIISGPAKAFDLSLDIDEDSVEKGERVTFTSTIEITGNDSNLPISEITLIIDGPTYKTCKFDVEGNKLSSCEGVLEINLIENNENNKFISHLNILINEINNLSKLDKLNYNDYLSTFLH